MVLLTHGEHSVLIHEEFAQQSVCEPQGPHLGGMLVSFQEPGPVT
jgi:hypothetical protein